jgi:hypothetical protein
MWAVRASASALGVGLAAALVLAPGEASANPMDLAPERLTKTWCDPSTDPNCGALDGTHATPDNAAWAKLVSQYAMAMAPMAMHPARTTGYGGFDFSLWGTITKVDGGADWLHKGTEGPISGGKFPSNNQSPDGVLQLYGVSGRKGLPYGFELEGSVGYMANTEMVVLGGGIRWALLEGFRTGALGYLPDLSIGGYVNTMTGSPKVRITVPSLDVQVSKPFTFANQVVFQPYIGWQLLWILADSAVVDGTPGFDAYAKCKGRPASQAEMNGTNPGNTTGGYDGGGNCTATTTAEQLDVNNNMVFRNIRYRRQRLMLGTAWRYEYVHFVLHGAFDLVSPESGGDDRIKGLASQFTFGAMVGASW